MASSASGPACLSPSAGNLLPDPGFEADLGAWGGQFNPQAAWNPSDATSCRASGSLQLSAPDDAGLGDAGAQVTPQGCRSVTPGNRYDFGAMVFAPSDIPAGQVSLQVVWDAYSDCHSPYAGEPGSTLIADSIRGGQWQSLASSAVAPAADLIVPAGAQAATMTLRVATGYVVLFDDLYLTECPGGF
jgi:hypothetical protein